MYKRSLAIWEKTLGPEHSDVATVLNNLADLYRVQGRYDEAEPLNERALTIAVSKLGTQHPHTRAMLRNFLALYRAQGRDKEIERLLREYGQ